MIFAGLLAVGISVSALLALAALATQNIAVAISSRPNAGDGWRQADRRHEAHRHRPARADVTASLFADQALLDEEFRAADAASHGGKALEARLATALLAGDDAGQPWRLSSVPALTVAKVEAAPRMISTDQPVQMASLTPAARPVEIAPAQDMPIPHASADIEPVEPEPVETARVIPLPKPRPADFARMAQTSPRARVVPVSLETAEPEAPAPRAERRTALAYAAPELEPGGEGPGDFFKKLLDRDQGVKLPPVARGVAIYDIASATVRLPNGEHLEAHSGLGHRQDDPRFVREKNRGPTPPNVYNLVMREALFHGTEAIRLLPRDQKKVFNRDGLLAHPYMYAGGGSRSQSNGCVVFKDYGRFLRAFKAGQIARLVVVPNIAELPSYMAGL